MLKNLSTIPVLATTVAIVGVVAIVISAALYSDAHAVTWSRNSITEGETLRLSQNGTYVAQWWRDVGTDTESRGHWEESNGTITLHPSHESGFHRGQFRAFVRRQLEGEPVLVSSDDLATFEGEHFGKVVAFHVQASASAR